MIKREYVDCIVCLGNKTKKYGLLKGGGQRYKCNDCNHTFAIGGIRGTYDSGFKNRVIENYCHRKQKVVDVLQHYGISSRTLIKRSKDHKKECHQCSDKDIS